MDVVSLAPTSARLGEVIQLYKRHASTLGFMPDGAFQDRAAKGTLAAAIDGTELFGFALYDLPARHVTLRQLCVSDSAKGMGVARTLVEWIAARHPERQGIRLSCRNDYDAATLWPRLDFEPLHERPGRSRAGHALTTWWRGFGHPTLLAAVIPADDPHVRAAIDTDVFLDLFDDRPQGLESRGLRSEWAQDAVLLVATKELVQEVYNHADASVRSRQRRNVQSLPRADEGISNEWEPIAADLVARLTVHRRLSTHDEADVRHVARAAASGVPFLLTRDSKFISRVAPHARDLGVELLTPGEFLQTLWRELGELYAPANLQNTSYRVEDLATHGIEPLVAVFAQSAARETHKALRQQLRTFSSHPRQWEGRVVLDGASAPVALFVRGGREPCEIPLLRTAGRNSTTIARHVVHLQRTAVSERGGGLVRIHDHFLSPGVPQALVAEGFTESDGEYWAATLPGLRTRAEVSRELKRWAAQTPGALQLQPTATRLRRTVSPTEADDLERRLSPMRLAGADLPCYLVPIKPAWAEQLFDTGLSEATLFGRSDSLGIAREHVYYSGAAWQLSVPGRILWYVSGSRKAAGTMAVRACSRLEEVTIGDPHTLFRKYRHYGVWRRKDIDEAAKRTGRAMALRFSDTQLFPSPVALVDLRAIASEFCHTPFLQSARKIPERMFDALYQRGNHGQPEPSAVSLSATELRGVGDVGS